MFGTEYREQSHRGTRIYWSLKALKISSIVGFDYLTVMNSIKEPPKFYDFLKLL